MRLRERLFGPAPRPITQDSVEAAPPPSAAVEKELERGSLVLLRERWMIGVTASNIQQRIAAQGAVSKLHGG